ncbi:hypothetical protein EC912_11122 [Luteibacter rhizovicinus]|uniref:Uncharacterized protein n=1 Tax=Luteibacter rhizovicinus TaxID=242606 RepID=A0A4V2W3C5_9GAMM|nr:hypothetical protein [Luteibacter rhizovicinus]TCV91429.1 hypothetical protein EC912_11122 [Luteibacter rhizovicinus]
MNLQRTSLLFVAGCGAYALAPHAHADDWTPVSDARLESERGGFDLGDGLKVSFGLERTVIVNGMTQVRNSVSIPDISKITTDEAKALSQAFGPIVIANGSGNSVNAALTPAANNASAAQSAAAATTAVTQAASAVASAAQTAASVAPASHSAAAAPTPASLTIPTTTLPALTAQSLNVPAFVVQNTLDNQAIQATTTIDASVNSVQLLSGMQFQSSLQDAIVRFRGN